MTFESLRKTRAGDRSFDLTVPIGVAVAIGAVVGGFILERGRLGDLVSLNSAVIVVFGSVGAVLIGTPGIAFVSAFRRCCDSLRRQLSERQHVTDRILRCASTIRRSGVAAIESEVESMDSGFLRRALLLVVDGVPPQEVRRQLESDIAIEEERGEADARVFEQAGGYAPTIGIIGSALGLIQVMRQLDNVEEVGRGIAAAFVSTLYGIGFANLLLLPLAARIRLRAQSDTHLKELILDGVTAIAEGQTPHVVRTRLDYAGEHRKVAAAPQLHARRKSA